MNVETKLVWSVKCTILPQVYFLFVSENSTLYFAEEDKCQKCNFTCFILYLMDNTRNSLRRVRQHLIILKEKESNSGMSMFMCEIEKQKAKVSPLSLSPKNFWPCSYLPCNFRFHFISHLVAFLRKTIYFFLVVFAWYCVNKYVWRKVKGLKLFCLLDDVIMFKLFSWWCDVGDARWHRSHTGRKER